MELVGQEGRSIFDRVGCDGEGKGDWGGGYERWRREEKGGIYSLIMIILQNNPFFFVNRIKITVIC